MKAGRIIELREYLRELGISLGGSNDSIHGWSSDSAYYIGVYDWDTHWNVVVKTWPNMNVVLREQAKTPEEVHDLLQKYYELEQLSLF